MLKVFVGFDERQRVSFTTLATSIYETASRPVMVSPLVLRTLPITRRGLTPFTYSRFLVPWLCDFQGAAIFMDADMLLASDITELEQQVEDAVAVSVVRSLDLYEQTSFMLLNCAHPSHRRLTPEFIQETDINLHGLQWVSESEIGALDPKWNQLIGYQDVDLTKVTSTTPWVSRHFPKPPRLLVPSCGGKTPNWACLQFPGQNLWGSRCMPLTLRAYGCQSMFGILTRISQSQSILSS